jgi:hypothetical protein
MYDLPFGRERKCANGLPAVLDAAVGGWQISVIGYLQTGVFLTPTISVPDPTGTRFTASANRPTVTIRPDQLRDASLADPTIQQWFDPTAFAAPPIGRFGNAGRISATGGPPQWQQAGARSMRLGVRVEW